MASAIRGTSTLSLAGPIRGTRLYRPGASARVVKMPGTPPSTDTIALVPTAWAT